MSATVLKEFLVALGFRVDARALRVFNTSVAGATTNVLGLGRYATSAGLAVTGMVTLVASQMERLYYQSRRVGTSVDSLQAFQFGMSQIGFSADSAQSMLERFYNETLNPGKQGLLAAFGVRAGEAQAQLEGLVDVLRQRYPGAPGSLGFMIRSKFAGMFGISPTDLIMFEKGRGEMARNEAERRRLQRLSGVDADELAEKSHQLMRDLNTMWETSKLIGQQIANDWVQPLTDLVITLNAGLESFLKWKAALGLLPEENADYPKDSEGKPVPGIGGVPIFGSWSRDLFEKWRRYGLGYDKREDLPLDMVPSYPLYGGGGGAGPTINLEFNTTITTGDPAAAGAALGPVIDGAAEKTRDILRHSGAQR